MKETLRQRRIRKKIEVLKRELEFHSREATNILERMANILKELEDISDA